MLLKKSQGICERQESRQICVVLRATRGPYLCTTVRKWDYKKVYVEVNGSPRGEHAPARGIARRVTPAAMRGLVLRDAGFEIFTSPGFLS